MSKVSLCVLYNDDNKLLLQERKNKSKFGENWSFFGGRVEEGETPEEALIREIREELNYDLEEYDYIDTYTNEFNGSIINVFISKFDDIDQFTLQEGSDMKLFSVNELRDLELIPGTEKIIDMVEKFAN